SRTIRIPTHVDERRGKLGRVRQRFIAEHHREPTIEELAEAAQIELRHAEEALEVVEASVSLNQRLGEDDGVEFGELLADHGAVDPEEAASGSLRDSAVRRALANLS